MTAAPLWSAPMLQPRERTTIEGDSITYNLALTDEMWAAWNVAQRYRESTVGSARIVPFVIDQREAAIERLRVKLNPNRQGRWCPPGDYMRLELRRDPMDTLEGAQTGEGTWYTMMSDTPDEANDHAQIISVAYGDVLIHGLGLGCLLSCCLANPDVNHVDVVEINRDVIDLIAPYYEDAVADGRLTIHHDNCLTKEWPPGSFWDVVWHDIWSAISTRNLSDDSTAEWGISYATLHRKFGHRCSWQGSWGFPQARAQRRREAAFDRRVARFVRRWNSSRPERRLRMLLDATRSPLMSNDQWVASLRGLRDPNNKGATMWDGYVERAQNTMDRLQAMLVLSRD